MRKFCCSLILCTSLFLSQILILTPIVRADQSIEEDFLPEPLRTVEAAEASARKPLQGVSSITVNPDAPSHLLFGAVGVKIKAPLAAKASATTEANTDLPQLLKELPKMAETQRQLHKLAAQQDTLVNGDKQVWFRIPPWMAGKWKTQDRQLIGEVNYRNGKQTPPRPLSFGYCGENYGLQQDKNGTFWQFEKVPAQPTNYHVGKNGLAHFNVVESNQSVASSDTQLVIKKIWRNVTMNPETQELINEKRFESVLTFKRLDEQSISVNEAVETFDGQGVPISTKFVQTVRVKVAPFQPVDNLRGDDMRTLFSQYMNHHGLGNLVAKG